MSENRPGDQVRRTANPRPGAPRTQSARPVGAPRPGTARPGASRPQAQRSGAARPANRPANGRPASSRQNVKRRKKKSNKNFIILVAVLAVLAVLIGVLVAVLTSGGDDNTTVKAPAATAAASNALVADNSAYGDGTDATDSENTIEEQLENANSTVIDDNTNFTELLGSSDSVIKGLSKTQMVTVDDLAVNTSLNSDWMNVLLLGVDARSKEESCRSDTMIICSINTKTGEVKLASIMRDTAVTFDDIGKYNGEYRINTANYFGGPELIMRTLNRLLDLNIQYYAQVDFSSMSVIVEKLGGITLDISEAEMELINKFARNQAIIAYNAGIDETGLENTFVYLEEYGNDVHLNGRQAVAYCRIRKIDSDFSRVERQRKVLIALMNKFRGSSAQEIMSNVMTLGAYMNTNLSIEQIISVACTVLGSNLSEVEQMYIPINNSYTLDTRGGQSMLFDTNWDVNKREVFSFIYE